MLGHGLDGEHCSAALVYQFLFEVKQLALEAGVGEDDRTSAFYMAHRLEQRPVVLLHEVGDDARSRARLPRITETKKTLNFFQRKLAKFNHLPVDEDGAT